MLLTIDHVGIACRNLDDAIERYVNVFGLAVVSQETNTEQGVREAMLATESGASYVQLLEPLSPDTPVGKFLERRGEGMHHVGYAVADVTAALAARPACG
jgi:methylmalonyl-CoA/ethylmalonyl-CoA epimerase